MNAVFVAAAEFPDVAKEYVIGFVPASEADEQGRREVSPVALLGLREGENLVLESDGRWDARYLPAFIRRYPLAYGLTPDGQRGVVVDAACEGLNDSEGELLLQDDGTPTPRLEEMMRFLDTFEQQLQSTRALCARIVELDLLEPVNIDVTLPDGRRISAGGLQMLGEARVKALPEAAVMELLKSGALGLLYAQLISMNNVHRLTERLARRIEPAAPTSPS